MSCHGFLPDGNPSGIMVAGDGMNILKAMNQVGTLCDEVSPCNPDHRVAAGKDHFDVVEILQVKVQVGRRRKQIGFGFPEGVEV